MRAKLDRITILLIILNIVIISFLIGFSYADLSYLLYPKSNKKAPEPIIEITKPLETEIKKFEREKENIENVITNVIPEIEEKPLYLDYISSVWSIFLHNSAFCLFLFIPMLSEFLFRIEKKYLKFIKHNPKIDKIINYLAIAIISIIPSINSFYAGIGMRITGFAFFYLFEISSLIIIFFVLLNYLIRRVDLKEYLNDLKFSLPLCILLFLAGAFEESIYLVRI